MVDNQNDFTLRVQHSDIVKAISQWFADGLGITKENVGAYVEEAIKPIINRAIESFLTNKRLEEIVKDYLQDYFIRSQYYIFSKKVNSIHDLAMQMIGHEVKDSVKDIVRKITDEYLTITYSPKKDSEEADNG